MGIYPVALTSASLQSARYFGFFPGNFMLRTKKPETTGSYESAGVRHFASRSFISEALPSCRGGTSASLCIERRRRARVRALARAQALLTRVVRYVTHVCLPCAHIARASRASRGAASVRCYPELPSRERAKATTRETSPESARVSRASAVSRHASADWLTACVLSHFASHTPAEPDPELPAAPVFAVSVPSRFCATQQVAKKNRDSLAPSSERAAVAFVRSTVEVRASAPNSDPNASRAFRARARGRAVRRERLFARTRLAR